METPIGNCIAMTRDGSVCNVDVLENGRIDLHTGLVPDDVVEFNCDGCVSLTELELSDLDELQVLSCRGCTSLMKIVVPSNLQQLNCDDCQVLKMVVVQRHGRLREVHCTGCPPAIIAGETAESIEFARTD